MSKQRHTVTFLASLPQIKSAILIDGMGDGGQIKLEVPGTDRAALIDLAEWAAGRVLRVTVEEAE